MGQDQEAPFGEGRDYGVRHIRGVDEATCGAGRGEVLPAGRHRGPHALRHRHEKPTPLPPWRMDSHSASATDPCLVTVYAALSICVSRPAADAVIMKWPRPRSTMPGSTCRAA